MLTPPHSSANNNQDRDPAPCYKGDVEDCNRDRESVSGGCLLWHFHPDMMERDMEIKFNQIIQLKHG